MPDTWLLLREEILLGTLTVEDVDQPWFICRFEPTEAFEEVRPLFERVVAIVDGPNLDPDALEDAYQKVKQVGVRLRNAEGGPTLGDFGLTLRGREAWLRY